MIIKSFLHIFEEKKIMQTINLDKRKANYLIRHPVIARTYICRHYPFSFEELKLYKNILIWKKISLNSNIKWSFEIIDYLVDDLDFNSEGNDYYPGFFCINYSLPWSIEFIKRYEHLWDWNVLMNNFKLRKNAEIYKYMQNTYLQYTTKEAVKDAYKEKNGIDGIDYEYYENFPSLYSKVRDLEESFKVDPITTWDEVEKSKSVNWDDLSKNSFLPWNEEIIEKYKNKLNFCNLCWNQNVPWSIEILLKYFDRFYQSDKQNFGKDSADNHVFITILFLNSSFPWNYKNIKELEQYIDFKDLLSNQDIDWTIELLELLETHDSVWNDDSLKNNKSVITKAFPELMQNEVMKEVWEMLL